MTAASMFLGSVNLMSGGLGIDALSTDAGTSWGNAQPTETTLNSFILSGSLVVNSGVEDREVTIAVSLGDNLDGYQLAALEATIAAELGKPNQLVYTPPNGPAQVFRVYTSNLIATPDDLREVASGQRLFTIRLVCEPYVYSATKTVVPALAPPPSSPTTVVIDSASSLTGWSTPTSLASFTTQPGQGGSGDVEILAQSGVIVGAPLATFVLVRSGTVTWGTTHYLSFDYLYTTSYGYAGQTDVTASLKVGSSDVPLDLLGVSFAPSPYNNYVRATFVVPDSVTTSSAITFTANTTASQDSIRAIHLTQVTRSNQPPFSGTSMQQTRSLTVGGSAPTVGSIMVSDASKALGDGTIVYTHHAPDAVSAAYSPPCSPWRVSGPARNPDASAVSGSSVVISSNEMYEIPLTALAPGVHAVVGRMKATSAGQAEIGVTYAQKMGGVQQTTEYVPHTVAVTTSYQPVVLGMKQLPVIDAAATPTSVQVLGVGYALGTVTLDEVWIFNLTLGRFTQVDLGSATPSSGGSSSRLWIDSPSLVNAGLGGLYRGTTDNRSDAVSAFINAAAPGVHELPPGLLKMFTVTPNTATSIAALEYYKAWLHNAAE